MDLLEQFRDYIITQNLFTPEDKLLLAVSGGVDSVAMCELCWQAGYKFGIAHCNFQLRDEESGRDEKFVSALARKYDVAFHVVRWDTKSIAAEKKVSIQEAARALRYDWFEELRQSTPYNFILTAHHADDNIETVSMNFFRGTGIKGIRGILPRQGKLVRPLLFARRKQLEEFIQKQNLAFVTDQSNLNDDYTRNYFRHHVLPMVEQVFPGAAENLLNNISRFREVAMLYDESIRLHKKKLLSPKGNELHIPVLKLKKTPATSSVLYGIVAEFGFTSRQVPAILDLLESESGRYLSSSTHRIIRNRQWLIIAPLQSTGEGLVVIDAPGTLCFENGSLVLKVISPDKKHIPDDKMQASLDADEIRFPLLLRKWKPGDYFYPLGMKKKKKISRFLIDQKVSRTDKENVWVLEMDKKILWVLGHRIDDRFKVTEKTRQVLNIHFLSGQTE